MATIEDLSKHDPDITDKQKSMIGIVYVSHLLEKHFEDYLLPFEITPPQYNVLKILQGQHPLTPKIKELAHRIVDRKSDVSRLMMRLEREGLVNRKRKKKDKRSMQVSITPKGLAMLEEIDNMDDLMSIPTSTITDEDSKILNNILRKMLLAFPEKKRKKQPL